jgi:hypothetical protein
MDACWFRVFPAIDRSWSKAGQHMAEGRRRPKAKGRRLALDHSLDFPPFGFVFVKLSIVLSFYLELFFLKFGDVGLSLRSS